MKMPIIESKPKTLPAKARIQLVPPHTCALDPLAALDTRSLADRYLDTLTRSSRRSMRANLQRVARMLFSRYDAFPWERLRADHMKALRAGMADRGLAPNTINVTLAALRGVARQAYEMGALDPEDYRLVREVKNVRGARVTATARALNLGEVGELLQACAQDSKPSGARDACLIALLAGAGLRRAEAVSLKLSDWHERTHTLIVRGKGNKERLVYLEDGGTRRALNVWLGFRGRESGALLLPLDQERKGRDSCRHMTGQAVYNAVEKRRLQAGLRRRFSPHDLRHFFADHLRELGAGIEDVSELLGHASIQTTAIYYHGGERAKRKAARLIRLPYRAGGGGGRRRRKKRKRRTSR